MKTAEEKVAGPNKAAVHGLNGEREVIDIERLKEMIAERFDIKPDKVISGTGPPRQVFVHLVCDVYDWPDALLLRIFGDKNLSNISTARSRHKVLRAQDSEVRDFENSVAQRYRLVDEKFNRMGMVRKRITRTRDVVEDDSPKKPEPATTSPTEACPSPSSDSSAGIPSDQFQQAMVLFLWRHRGLTVAEIAGEFKMVEGQVAMLLGQAVEAERNRSRDLRLRISRLRRLFKKSSKPS